MEMLKCLPWAETRGHGVGNCPACGHALNKVIYWSLFIQVHSLDTFYQNPSAPQ